MSNELKAGLKGKFLAARTPAELVEIPVEGLPSVYYWPNPSMRELIAMEEGFATGLKSSAMLATVIARARDSAGRLLFSESERDDLLDRYGPETIARIAGAMTVTRVKPEDAEKN